MQWGKQMVLGKLDIKRPKRAWPPVITGLSVKPCFCCCCLVAQLYQTLCDPMDYSLTGSSIHGISQAGILEWVDLLPGDLPGPEIQPVSPALVGRFFTTEPTGKPKALLTVLTSLFPNFVI